LGRLGDAQGVSVLVLAGPQGQLSGPLFPVVQPAPNPDLELGGREACRPALLRGDYREHTSLKLVVRVINGLSIFRDFYQPVIALNRVRVSYPTEIGRASCRRRG